MLDATRSLGTEKPPTARVGRPGYSVSGHSVSGHIISRCPWLAIPLSLVLVLLTQTSCCTTAGLIGGAIFDGRTQKEASVTPREASRRHEGTRISIMLRDSSVVRGVVAECRDAQPEELWAIYRGSAAGQTASGRLPIPGDTIMVSGPSVRGWGRFGRFLNTGRHADSAFIEEDGAAAQFDFVTPGAHFMVPLAEIAAIQWADSVRTSGSELIRMAAGRVPVEPRILTVRTDDGAEVRVGSWEMASAEVYPWRHGKLVGVTLGMAADAALAYQMVWGPDPIHIVE
jgi:hypothetical protein